MVDLDYDRVKQAYVDMGNGTFVERDVFAVAQKVAEYDSNLRVQFLNDAARDVGEPPYRIVELCKDGIERPLFSVWILDNTVLQRIFAADTQKWDILTRVDSTNARAKRAEKWRYREEMDAAKEIVATVVASPKDTYSIPDVVLKEGTGKEALADPNKLTKFRA